MRNGIHRQLTDLGWDCQVVAPSLIPKKAGDRVRPTGGIACRWRGCIGRAS